MEMFHKPREEDPVVSLGQGGPMRENVPVRGHVCEFFYCNARTTNRLLGLFDRSTAGQLQQVLV